MKKVRWLNSNSFSEPDITKRDVYDVVIDKQIIGILTSLEEKSSRQLKESLENIIKRKISSHTFSTHVSNLIELKLVQKGDLGRGRTISYSLTELARKKIGLGLLGNDEERIEQLKRVYNAILFYHILYYFPKILSSDKEFRQVLVKLGVKENELEWGFISYGDDDSPFMVYGRDRRISMGRQPPSVYKGIVAEYWRDRPGLSTVLAEVKFVCYPCKGNLEIYIDRIEHWQINKNSSNRKYLTEYHFHLCGFSVGDIVNVSGARYNFVDEAFANLKKLNLIRLIKNIGGAPKFRFKDKKLEDLFAALWEVHADGEFWLLLKKWSYFDKPTEAELIRLERLLGKVESERIKRLCDRTRSKTIVALRKSKTIYEFIRYLTENREVPFLDVPSTITNGYKEYALFLKENDSDRYKNEISSGIKRWCTRYEKYCIERYKDDIFFKRALERFNQTRGHATVSSKKDKIKEVRDFYETLRNIEYEYLKSLPHDFHENILEDIKMEFGDTINKYSFFDDIMKDVCPRISEQPDYELQDKIMAGEVENQKAYQKLAKRMRAIYTSKGKWHNLKSTSGKKIPYKLLKIRSHQTGKFVRVCVPDLTDVSGW